MKLKDWLESPATDYLKTPGLMTQPKEVQHSGSRVWTEYHTPNVYRVMRVIGKEHRVAGFVRKLGKRQFRNENTGRLYRSLTEAAASITLVQTVASMKG